LTELLQKLIDAVKGLTFVNVAILACLVLLGIPAYLAWKAINNPTLLGQILSEFKQIRSEGDCNVFLAQLPGAPPMWGISNPFAERNAEAWGVVVRIRFEPDEAAIKDYCTTMEELVAYMRDPETQPPTFPGSTKLLIYREHHYGKEGP